MQLPCCPPSVLLPRQLLREPTSGAPAAAARLERALRLLPLNLRDALAVQLPLVDAALDVLLCWGLLPRLVQPLVPLRPEGWCHRAVQGECWRDEGGPTAAKRERQQERQHGATTVVWAAQRGSSRTSAGSWVGSKSPEYLTYRRSISSPNAFFSSFLRAGTRFEAEAGWAGDASEGMRVLHAQQQAPAPGQQAPGASKPHPTACLKYTLPISSTPMRSRFSSAHESRAASRDSAPRPPPAAIAALGAQQVIGLA